MRVQYEFFWCFTKLFKTNCECGCEVRIYEFINKKALLDTIIPFNTELLEETHFAVVYFYAANIIFPHPTHPKKKNQFVSQICTIFGSTYLHEQLFSLVNSETCLTHTFTR
jgi:hypothetical protein